MNKVKSINVTKKFQDKKLGFSRLELNLKGKDINHVVTNSIKRVAQSTIPIYAFNDINISENTSIFNNNYIKDHIRNIPVWGIENKIDEYIEKEKKEEYFSETTGLVDDDIDLTVDKEVDTSSLNELNMYIQYKNNSKEVYTVTTNDAEFHYKEGLIKSPYYNPIQIVKLQPGQSINIEARATLGKEELSGIYSATGVCFFKENSENDYDFILESRGQIEEKRILLLSLKMLNKKLKHFLEILPKNKGIEGVIEVENEDHTLGNLITMAMQSHSSVHFCGYNTPHPLKKEIHFHYKLNSGNVNSIMKEIIIYYEDIFQQLEDKIKKL